MVPKQLLRTSCSGAKITGLRHGQYPAVWESLLVPVTLTWQFPPTVGFLPRRNASLGFQNVGAPKCCKTGGGMSSKSYPGCNTKTAVSVLCLCCVCAVCYRQGLGLKVREGRASGGSSWVGRSDTHRVTRDTV